MKRPTSLKVSGIKYRIRYDHADSESYGETDPDTNTINIRENLPEDKQLRVLVHELTHAVIFETPFSVRKRFDLEEVCDIVGWHFLDMLRANPEIAQYILQEIEDTNE
jgi:Zn-dependent peptidase ImmA (M78 family)